MSGLLGDQVEITSRSPLKMRRLDDASTVNDVSAETVTFQYNNSGALASATGEAAGTMIYAKLTFDGILNSFKDKVGDMKDSSFVFVTGIVLTTALAIDIEREVDNWRRLSVTEKFAEMAKHMATNGQYWVDHADGAIWGISADTVADDTANYSYKAPITGGGGPASNVNIDKLGSETLGDHGTAVIDHGIQPLYEAKDYDGAALPNAVTEGQAVRPASTLSGITFTFQTNEDGSVAIIPVAHDSADSGAPLKIGGKASTSEPTAVATGDRVDGFFDEYGRLHIRNIVYDTSSGADKSYITNSLNGDYINGFIDVDTTNVGAGPTYYPSSSGISLDGYKSLSFSGKMIEADAEANTLTVQVTNDEDTTNADWQTVHFIDLITSTTTDAGSYVCNATTTQMFGLLKDLNARYVRLKFVGGASATNTLIVKVRTIPL